MAASISSGIGGTMVFSCSGRFSVMVATGGSVLYSRVSNRLVGMPAVSPSAHERGDGFGDRSLAGDEVEASGLRCAVRPAPRRAPPRRPRGECCRGRSTRRSSTRPVPGSLVSMPGRTMVHVSRRAGPDRFVGNAFGAQIHLRRPRRRRWRRGSAAIAETITYRLDARGFRGVGQQDRRVAVDGLLACRPAARARARGEHHGVGAPQVFGDLVDRGLLQVDDDAPRRPRLPGQRPGPGSG